jgi:hypothetical protein
MPPILDTLREPQAAGACISVSLRASGICCRLLIRLTLPCACATVFTGDF